MEATLIRSAALSTITEIAEYPSTDIIHMQAGTFPILQFQLDNPLFRVNGLYQPESDGVPQLSADNINTIKAKLGNFKEFTEGQTVHFSVTVLVNPCTTAEYATDKLTYLKGGVGR